MRFVLYNIRYGTGGGGRKLPWGGYLRRTHDNLGDITVFLKDLNPDIVGLVEVDAGSYRSQKLNQAQVVAKALGHYHSYRSKYQASHLPGWLPFVHLQGNAFVTRDTIINEQFHYFEKGIKRLVIELELENLTIFLVHLALGFRARHHQLSDLYSLVVDTPKPHIVAGDFNARWGDREIRLFMAATKLANAMPNGAATFPSWQPRRQLDFILHSPEISCQRLWMPRVDYSDHLPLVCDFEIRK
ncbi:MAG: endonuclease/exonuclease/phosphatase family protein [Kiritimatiellae bacterium]|nr:endonuclease/exonuclease/phosphatase family protein [Kiritimatiellia bacterium]